MDAVEAAPWSKRITTRPEWIPACPGCGRAGRGHRKLATGKIVRVDHGTDRGGAVSFCTRTAGPHGDLTPVRVGPEEADARGQAFLRL